MQLSVNGAVPDIENLFWSRVTECLFVNDLIYLYKNSSPWLKFIPESWVTDCWKTKTEMKTKTKQNKTKQNKTKPLN